MRPQEELRFIRDRVMAEIRANPPQGPLLTDHCRNGHVSPEREADGHCKECRRDGRRRRKP